MVPRGGDSSLYRHHAHTVIEAIPRISCDKTCVKDMNLVYPVVYPNVSHMMCLQSSYCIWASEGMKSVFNTYL
jgi:hypothetical protein